MFDHNDFANHGIKNDLTAFEKIDIIVGIDIFQIEFEYDLRV